MNEKRNNQGNNSLVGVAIAVLLIVGAFFAFRLLTGDSQQSGVQQQETSFSDRGASEEGTSGQQEDSLTSDGSYVAYTEGVLEENKDKKRVLYFYANWCPICKPVDAEFKAKSDQIPEDTVVIRVNYNDSDTDKNEEQLADKYVITYQHTFVQIDSQGNEVTKWNSGGLDELLDRLK